MNLKRLIQLLSASLFLASSVKSTDWRHAEEQDYQRSRLAKMQTQPNLDAPVNGKSQLEGLRKPLFQASRLIHQLAPDFSSNQRYDPQIRQETNCDEDYDKVEPNHHASRLLQATTTSFEHSDLHYPETENVEEYDEEELEDGPTDPTYASKMILYSSMVMAPAALIGLTVYIVMTHGKQPEESQFGEMQA